MHKDNIVIALPTLIKNKVLVEQRRQQIINASVDLFIENGFHKTTTRQIARASGISTGSLYEYIASKEDILYLVCNSIHAEIERKVGKAVHRVKTCKRGLDEIIKEYFRVCHHMRDRILLIYQETGSLPKKWRKIVFNNEMKVTALFKGAILELVESNLMPPIETEKLDLITHNIVVLGHMWTFRRWFMTDNYSIDDYITIQTKNIRGMYFASSEQGKLNLKGHHKVRK